MRSQPQLRNDKYLMMFQQHVETSNFTKAEQMYFDCNNFATIRHMVLKPGIRALRTYLILTYECELYFLAIRQVRATKDSENYIKAGLLWVSCHDVFSGG